MENSALFITDEVYGNRLLDSLSTFGFAPRTHGIENVMQFIDKSYIGFCILHITSDVTKYKLLATELRDAFPNLVIVAIFEMITNDATVMDLLQYGCNFVVTYPYSLPVVAKMCIMNDIFFTPKISKKRTLKFGNVVLDQDARILSIGDIDLHTIPRMAANVLAMLMTNGSSMTLRRSLLVNIWHADNYYTSRSLDGNIATLRKILTGSNVRIELVKSRGYYLREVVE